MVFSIHDKYGKIKDPHPRIAIFLLALIFCITVYKNYESGKFQKENLKTKIEKDSGNLLFAELKEENLEYYLNEPYCGYVIESKGINLKNINRQARGAEIFSKNYSAGKDNIKITLCYSTSHIDSKTHKHLLIIIILTISLFILTRRHFAYEKSKRG